MSHTPLFGSGIAKDGFLNEIQVRDAFNNWKTSSEAQICLKIMGYEIDKIERVEAFLAKEIIKDLIKDGTIDKHYNAKTDIQIKIRVYYKGLIDYQNISIKLVKNKNGFNQIDKRWVDKYAELWKFSLSVIETLKLFTGELPPNKIGTKDKRRMFLHEMDQAKVKELIEELKKKRVLIISNILQGVGPLKADWMLVSHNHTKPYKWILKSMPEVINFCSLGEIIISPRGSLYIGPIFMQRKGGDGGRETAKMLQFKFDPINLLKI